ncbi:hypothetical protein [Polynucleobacter sp. AP-RePozz3-80-G7]|uniref:hypothetical protein n=1 Tax=Polynucleobacter sp. AP-RePozz3-80-G7 TaxID=2689105 RepID=UPI001C0DF440|nr:hypothetical protein [Polynucleobacter sp. AP-RePozz3-80-G7]MBU3639641.1 hypothetical protein [Polynucleobacter sp. AP-RePozz3-80-G7]
MLQNSELLESLELLERLYTDAPTKASLLHSKHALLELCGWIEEAQDAIVKGCAQKLLDDEEIEWIAQKIEDNHHFKVGNFKNLISLVIGLNKYKEVHSNLSSTGLKYLPMIAAINSLVKPRNSHAHTHFEEARPMSKTLQSPSVLRQEALKIYEGFCELEEALRSNELI